jgi:nicotinate phosphoribosyltransferase
MVKAGVRYRDLLIPVMRQGKRISAALPLAQIREEAKQELARFHPAMRRFLYPQPYFVGLEESVYETKLNLIRALKQEGG